MDRRKLWMAGVVAGSMTVGAVFGAVAFTPGIGLAATGTDAGEEFAEVCTSMMGAGRGFGFGFVGPLEIAAETIGIEESELLDALQGGDTIAEVAEEHGVAPSAVVDAIVSAHRARLDEAVEDGDLTQEQADGLLEEAEERAADLVDGELDVPSFAGRPGPWRVGGGALEAALEAIGIDLSDAMEALRDGTTIAQIAEEHGVDVDAVVDAVVEALRDHLNQAVEQGWLDEDEAEERADALEEQARAIVNGEIGPFPLPGPWGGEGIGRWHGGSFGPASGLIDGQDVVAEDVADLRR